MSKARDLAERGGVDGALSNRNRIINGNFSVWQRGTSWGVGVYAYKADRFQDQGNAAFERSTDAPDGFKYSAKIHSWNGGAQQITTTLENDGFFYNGQTLTISIWAKATSNITIKMGDIYSTGQNALVGSGSYVNITTSWQRYSVTVTLSGYNKTTSTGLVFYPYGNLSDGAVTLSTSDSLWLTGFQVEEGDTVTPFEHRSYDQEHLLCQRYFQRFGGGTTSGRMGIGAWNNSTSADIAVHLTHEMRVTPTVTAVQGGRVLDYAVAWHDVTSLVGSTESTRKLINLNVQNTSQPSAAIQGDSAALGGGGAPFDYWVDAEL
jgi:hypothetical protein